MAHDYSSEDCDWQSDGNRSSDCHQGHCEADPSRKLSFLERRSLMPWIERPLVLADMASDVEYSRYVFLKGVALSPKRFVVAFCMKDIVHLKEVIGSRVELV